MTSRPDASMQPMVWSGVAVIKELELRTEIVPKPLSTVEEASHGKRAATVQTFVIVVNIVTDAKI